MIIGTHILLYSNDTEADRAFFRDVLEFPSVDAGHGWLIFKLPPAEAALHPSEGGLAQGHDGPAMLGAELYLMCDDLQAVVKSLAAKNVICAAIDQVRWGIKTRIRLPSGGEIGLYQPTHPIALGL
jgi:catechol 2,3-dioxygenase-like lactoylglutathione lyase family enzyme